MGYKRPFDDGESREHAFKHPRLLDYSNQLASSIEGVLYKKNPGYIPEDHEEDFNDAGEEISDDDDFDVKVDRGAAEEDEGGVENVSEACTEKLADVCSFNPAVKLGVTHPHDGGEDHDAQDDSCTSYECQHSGADSSGPVDAGVIM